MLSEDIKITTGENEFQIASFEINDKTIDYKTSKNLDYRNIISLLKGLDIASEFYDVNAAIITTGNGICSAVLGKTINDAIVNAMDSNPIDFMTSTITLTTEADSEIVKYLKDTNIIAAPKFTKNAVEYLENHNICYVIIETPLKDYKKYLSNKILETPLGTLTQAPNLSELNKDSFNIVSKTKPEVEQIEDAIFAWKIAKHAVSQAIVIAKDLKTTAIAQGLQSASVEYALDYSCEMSKDAILATDMGLTVHDINVASQGRIGTIILPTASKEIIDTANKYNMAVITTGFTNILY